MSCTSMMTSIEIPSPLTKHTSRVFKSLPTVGNFAEIVLKFVVADPSE